MRERHLIHIIIFSIAFLAFPGLLASCGSASPTVFRNDARNIDQEKVDARAVAPFDASVGVPEVKVTAIVQETMRIDGGSILEAHCSQCHLVESLIQINKTPTEWEGVLQQMEMMGVHLAETEKASLLDYLTAAEKP
jgi:hypothetical protein